MPTIRAGAGPYRFFFYSFDCHEPRHVHVQRENMVCKFWLEPLALASNHSFPPHELNRIRELLRTRLRTIIEAWDEHCGR